MAKALSSPPPPFSAVFSDQGFREFRSSKRRREGEDAKMEAVLFLFQSLGAVFWMENPLFFSRSLGLYMVAI